MLGYTLANEKPLTQLVTQIEEAIKVCFSISIFNIPHGFRMFQTNSLKRI